MGGGLKSLSSALLSYFHCIHWGVVSCWVQCFQVQLASFCLLSAWSGGGCYPCLFYTWVQEVRTLDLMCVLFTEKSFQALKPCVLGTRWGRHFSLMESIHKHPRASLIIWEELKKLKWKNTHASHYHTSELSQRKSKLSRLASSQMRWTCQFSVTCDSRFFFWQNKRSTWENRWTGWVDCLCQK